MRDGGYYEGQFVEGEMSGEGVRSWGTTGHVYRGHFYQGEMCGKGCMEYSDGRVYNGDWVDNKQHGMAFSLF